MSDTSFATPIDERYLEDYVAGSVHELGPIRADEQEMIEFARRYDPQVFHTDPEASKRTMYGGLIASGWFTASLMMRLYVDQYVSHVASLGSPGIDELRWLKPVRPGDLLSARATVLESRRSRTKPDRGVITTLIEMLNQHGDMVMTMKAVNLMLARDRE